MNCKNGLKDFLGEYIKGTLSSEKADLVRKHLEQCPECALEASQIERLLPGLAHLADEHITPEEIVDYVHFTKSKAYPKQSEIKKIDEIEEHLTICDRCQSELKKLIVLEELEIADERLASIPLTESGRKVKSEKFRSKLFSLLPSRRIWYAIAAVVVLILVFIPKFSLRSQGPMMAVLPFEYEGPPEMEYLAEGISSEITRDFEGVSAAGVISTSSSLRYKNTPKLYRQIADELNVDYLVVGTLQWDTTTNQVKLNTRLVRAEDDSCFWSDSYKHPLQQLYALPYEIVGKVTMALNLTLLEPELQNLKLKTTDNIKAYEFYLRGNNYFNRGFLEKDYQIAVPLYQKAIELDSNFALAYSRLSRAQTEIYWHYDRTDSSRLLQAKESIDKALRIQSDLPEAHLALGSFYYHKGEYIGALEEFSVAQKSLPNNSDLWAEVAYTQRHQGKWDKAIANIKKASDLDPNNALKAFETGQTYRWMREYPEAERYYNRAISAAPDWKQLYGVKSLLYVIWKGSIEKAKELLQDQLPKEVWDQYDLIEGKYQKILSGLTLKGASSDTDSASYYFSKAEIYGYMNQPQLMRTYYDSAARVYLEKQVQTRAEDPAFHSQVGIVYAGLERKEEAIREGKKAMELLPLSKDAIAGTGPIENLARIYVMIEEYELAIDQLEFLLSIPGTLSITYLRLHPQWAPLRDHPRFQQLLKRGVSRA